MLSNKVLVFLIPWAESDKECNGWKDDLQKAAPIQLKYQDLI